MEAKLGLRENWKQFTILVVINAFVGGMIGLERTILPELAQQEFAILAKSAILSFIVVFGFTKAITNYFAGTLANKIGRKNLLVYGWIVALPVPFMLIFADNWNWIIMANVLLGINQGLTWSSTVVMKIDLVGEKDRGFAMGLNEFAGYLAVAIVALLSGYLASTYGLRPYPFLIGIGLSVLGLLGSIFLVKDTRKFVAQESKTSLLKPLKNIFLDTTFLHPNLSSVTQAGLINNLNDGMVWGLLPVLLAAKGYNLAQIGIIVAIYPAVWGLGQLFTGKLADLICKKKLLFWGMLLQGIAIVLLVYAFERIHYIFISIILGLGTAVVYPAFLAAIADDTNPDQRAESIGIFRLWRDSGYAFGAILSGILADALGMNYAIGSIGFLTILSAIIIQLRMSCSKLNEIEKAIINISRSLIIISILFILVAGIFISTLYDLGTSKVADIQSIPEPAGAISTIPSGETKQKEALNVHWTSPDESSIPAGEDGERIRYGKDLIAHTSTFLGPKGTVANISNGMNCQNCHLDAGTKHWGNNYSAVYSTYPKFRARSGTKETIVKRVNDCFERSLNGQPLDSTSNEMIAIVAYMKWLGTGVEKGKTPEGAGLQKLAFLNRGADPQKGALVYTNKCKSCHGNNGEGMLNAEKTAYTFPPLWGKNSYNDGAGLYRLSGFSGYVKNNMPLGASYENPLLTEEEAWDVAAFVNSQPRPHKDQSTDWKDVVKKPFDFPFGPYADKFSEKQHKYGPFEEIAEAMKAGAK